MVGELCIDFKALYKDNEASVLAKLEKYNEMIDQKDNSEGILDVVQCIKCVVHFKAVDRLQQAYEKILASRHVGFITKLEPELDTEHARVTVHMGVEYKTSQGGQFPLIGELELRFGVPTRKKTIGEHFRDLKNEYDLRYIIERLKQIYEDV